MESKFLIPWELEYGNGIKNFWNVIWELEYGVPVHTVRIGIWKYYISKVERNLIISICKNLEKEKKNVTFQGSYISKWSNFVQLFAIEYYASSVT